MREPVKKMIMVMKTNMTKIKSKTGIIYAP